MEKVNMQEVYAKWLRLKSVEAQCANMLLRLRTTIRETMVTLPDQDLKPKEYSRAHVKKMRKNMLQSMENFGRDSGMFPADWFTRLEAYEKCLAEFVPFKFTERLKAFLEVQERSRITSILPVLEEGVKFVLTSDCSGENEMILKAAILKVMTFIQLDISEMPSLEFEFYPVRQSFLDYRKVHKDFPDGFSLALKEILAKEKSPAVGSSLFFVMDEVLFVREGGFIRDVNLDGNLDGNQNLEMSEKDLSDLKYFLIDCVNFRIDKLDLEYNADSLLCEPLEKSRGKNDGGKISQKDLKDKKADARFKTRKNDIFLSLKSSENMGFRNL